ncbi:hypothetical protein GJAV_G00176310 [Gymnothorax javanicus]|nr:hypothetical protein GJAV_G00176310 [Gymnothorax javanicus]
MSNTQDQSLNPDVVFSPVFESSPEFLHCERERRALESLLKDGPFTFQNKLKHEQLGAFLSPEEAAQICGWAQEYRHSQVLPRDGQDGPSKEHLSSCYWPAHTDTPPPDLELGWPVGRRRLDARNTMVYTNPPLPGVPPIREVLRKMIQGAQTLIAVVTEKLTDSAVIGDLNGAASRGVPVYVILNKRSAHDGFTSPRLIHQNIRVRVLGGKQFCSRDGKMVVGELKENFLLVDLDSVMVGTYSLTWADAHLHRNLVTVFSGSVVDSFDKEFRILYAASTPIPESCWANHTLLRVENAFSLLTQGPRPLPLDIQSEKEVFPSPTNDPIDWEALGVVNKDQFVDDPSNLTGQMAGISLPPPPIFERRTMLEKEPLIRRMEFQRCVPQAYEEQSRKHRFLTETHHLPGSENLHWHERFLSKPQSWQKNYETDSMRQTVWSDIHKMGSYSVQETTSTVYNQQINDENGHDLLNLKKDSDRGARLRPQMIGPGEKGSRLTKKPLILMVPVPENGSPSDFNDILKGFRAEPDAQENPQRGNMVTGQGMNMHAQDRGLPSAEAEQQDKTLPAWRTHSHDKSHLTPALALLKSRPEEVNATSSRVSKMYSSPFRARSSSFDLPRDWRRPILEWERPLQQAQEHPIRGGH